MPGKNTAPASGGVERLTGGKCYPSDVEDLAQTALSVLWVFVVEGSVPHYRSCFRVFGGFLRNENVQGIADMMFHTVWYVLDCILCLEMHTTASG